MKGKLHPALVPLSEVQAEAIAFLRKHEPKEGYFVGFSGGKDSIVALELCRMANVKHTAFYSCTGIDAPEVVKFIKQHYPDVVFLYPKMSFWEGIRRKSPPLRTMRWCCDVLKKDPSKHIPLQKRVMGIRAEESANRAAKPRIDPYEKQTVYKPIFYWLEWHIWEFIEKYKLPYPSLYDEGFDRIGCVICPFITHKNLKKVDLHRARWPKMFKIFELSVKKWFASYRTKPTPQQHETPEQYLEAYYRGFEVDTIPCERCGKPSTGFCEFPEGCASIVGGELVRDPRTIWGFYCKECLPEMKASYYAAIGHVQEGHEKAKKINTQPKLF